jgi:hypothetical protein
MSQRGGRMLIRENIKNKQKVNSSKANQIKGSSDPHPFLGAIIDLYISEAIYRYINLVWLFICGKEIETILYMPVALIITTMVIFYYSIVSNKVKWLSPGEIIVGRLILDGKKIWVNPYGISRGLLFALIIIALVFTRDSISQLGFELSAFGLIVIFIKTAIVYAGLLLVGRGKLIGSLPIIILLIISFLFAQYCTNVAIRYSGIISLIVAIVFSGIVLYYHNSRKPS